MMNNFSVAVQQILETNADFLLQSSFFPTGRSIMVNRKLNEMVEEMPELRHTVTAIVLYPALRWVIDTQPDVDLVSVDRMGHIQDLIVEVTGERQEFRLENRQQYLSAIQDIVRVMDQSIDHIGRYPGNGKSLREVLYTILHGPGPMGEDVTYYKINKNFEDCVLLLDSVQRSTFKQQLSVMSRASHGDIEPDESFDFAYLYHNTRLLLKHYAKIVWSRNCVDGRDDDDIILRDKAVALLNCESVDDMFSVTASHSTYHDAYNIAGFMKLISGAINKVGKFPRFGEESKRILELLTDPNTIGFSFEGLDDELPYGKSVFYEKKRVAVKLLSFCLWGCSPNELLELLIP